MGGGESLMVEDADFKVIFNFKPCSPCEMKPSAPDNSVAYGSQWKPATPPSFSSFCHGGI